MLHEVFNSYYVIYAFLIGFALSFVLSLLISWVFAMRYECSTFPETIIVLMIVIVLMIFIGLMAFLEGIPNWVRVLLGMLFGLMIEKLYRLWSSDI